MTLIPKQLIAYRGLWDRLAPPCSFAAILRSYIKGIPSLARPSSALELNDVLIRLKQELPDNCFNATALLILEPATHWDEAEITAQLPAAGLILINRQSTKIAPVYNLGQNGDRESLGQYVPLELLIKVHSGELLAPDCVELVGDSLFYESLTTLQKLEEIGAQIDQSDERLLGNLPSLEQFKNIFCITDLVEQALLAQQPPRSA